MLENVGNLEEMNIMYNNAYDSKTWICQDEKFEKVVLVARDGCKLTRLKWHLLSLYNIF